MVVVVATRPTLKKGRQHPGALSNVAYKPRGVLLDLFYMKDPEIVIAGPAGTGKSRACLEKLYLCAAKYAGMRALVVRKTRESLTQSAMVTFEMKVLPPESPVYFHTTDQAYRFPNGSTIAVGGLDKVSKIMSSEYDIIYVPEATELSENDWESLTTRLRNGVMPYQQLLADCNPGPPTHWLKKRAERGATVMLESRHEDNPTLWDIVVGAWTDVGKAYIAKLDALTGARRARLRFGRWRASEGQVYEGWEPGVHLIDKIPGTDITKDTIPLEWPRHRGIDFGFTNPFCCQWWAADPDGRIYLYREFYGTQRLVEDWAVDIRDVEKEAGERATTSVADHDAEGRATLNSKGVWTAPATKAVAEGIQAVQARVKLAGDGKPRLYIFRGACVRQDPMLEEKHAPTCTAEEIDGYVWAKSGDGQLVKEAPVKENDHGMDTMRYVVMGLDGGSEGIYF